MTIDEILKSFILNKSQLMEIVDFISNALNRGYFCEDYKFLYSPLDFFNDSLKNDKNSTIGPERLFSIDFGGTNLRILATEVIGSKLSSTSTVYPVPTIIKTGTSKDFFDFIANRISDGLVELGFEGAKIDCMGFTLSFPCRQTALNNGKIIEMGKDYKVSGLIGQDVVEKLLEACKNKGLKIKDFALVNDVVGILLCGKFEFPSTQIGVINGTGTNVCFLKKVTENREFIVNFNRWAINIEWGAFGDDGELQKYRSPIDLVVDNESINNGRQIFEKMISGKYLGKIVGLLIGTAADNGIVFKKELLECMNNDAEDFSTSFISLSYNKNDFIREFYERFNYHLNEEEYECIFKICDTISQRSAALCAAGLTALLITINTPGCVIAADGSMFRHHPLYLKYVESYIAELRPDLIFKIEVIDDGSGKGGAVAACFFKEKLKYLSVKNRTNQNFFV